MIKIIRDDKTAKKYLHETKRLFDLCKYTIYFQIEEEHISDKLIEIIKKIKESAIELEDQLKRDIILLNLLSDSTLTDLAQKYNFSISYIYALKQKILKEFAMILFEVVIL